MNVLILKYALSFYRDSLYLMLRGIQVLRNAVGGGVGARFPPKKHYEDVRFNVINVTRGWVGVKFRGKNVT